MQIINLEFESWSTVLLRLNWIAIVLIAVIMCAIPYGIKMLNIYVNKRSITIDEISLGIGNSSVKLIYSKNSQEIAYKLWVEMSTRKMGLVYDEENDVIIEIYNSWYEFFKIARGLLKEIPANQLKYSSDLITLTEKILNKGLRPHLTRWQAKYRKWYEGFANGNMDKSPQDLQKEYPYYEQLLIELVETNKRMVEYKELMRKIAFEKY